MSPSPKPATESQLVARIASEQSWANTPDRAARTAPARRALDARFLADAEGDPIRAAHLRRAYFARLALKSAQSRRRAREATEAAEGAEAELAGLAEHIANVVALAPPLSDEQLDKLAHLLRPTSPAGGAPR